MRISRRFAALLLSAALGVLSLLAFTGASPAGAYPATICATISVSATNPVAGTPITVTGEGFTPGVQLTLVLEAATNSADQITFGAVTVTAAGTFTLSLVVPPGLGEHVITAIGDGLSTVCPADPFTNIDVTAAAVDTGGLASTGSDVMGLLAVAIVLVGLGSVVIVAGRRKRTCRHARTF